MGSAPGHACFWHPVSSGSRAKDEGDNGGTGGRRFSASGTVIQSERLQRMSGITLCWVFYLCWLSRILSARHHLMGKKVSVFLLIDWIVLDQHWCDTVFSMRYQWNCSSFDSSLSLILLSFATKFVFVHNFVFFSLMFCILGTLWFIPNCLLGNLIPNHQISDHFLLNCHQFTYKLHGPEFDDMYWLVWNFSFIYQILFKI